MSQEPQETKEEARLRQLLEEVESMNFPDYPAYRTGCRWGLVCAIPVFALVLFVLCISSKDILHTLLIYGWTAPVIAGTIFLLVWAIGAFRPTKL